jgi:hypothetical protein
LDFPTFTGSETHRLSRGVAHLLFKIFMY